MESTVVSSRGACRTRRDALGLAHQPRPCVLRPGDRILIAYREHGSGRPVVTYRRRIGSGADPDEDD